MTALVLILGAAILAVALVGWRTRLGRRTAAPLPVPGPRQGPHWIHACTGRAPNGVWSPARESVSGLTKAQAEELLDWLEGNGQGGYEVTHDEAGFTVRRR